MFYVRPAIKSQESSTLFDMVHTQLAPRVAYVAISPKAGYICSAHILMLLTHTVGIQLNFPQGLQ